MSQWKLSFQMDPPTWLTSGNRSNCYWNLVLPGDIFNCYWSYYLIFYTTCAIWCNPTETDIKALDLQPALRAKKNHPAPMRRPLVSTVEPWRETTIRWWGIIFSWYFLYGDFSELWQSDNNISCANNFKTFRYDIPNVNIFLSRWRLTVVVMKMI